MNKFLKRLDPWRLMLEPGAFPGMRAPGMIYADEYIESLLEGEDVLSQVAGVACLPGIVGYSMAMPDIHQGYGFPIGGVAAFDVDEGVISPGGVGYDISCGVRLLATNIAARDFRPRADKALAALFAAIPCGVGAGKDARSDRDLEAVLKDGAAALVRAGMGTEGDLDKTEEGGRLAGALPDAVSGRAKERGRNQLGTLGSGNHFIEIQEVDELFLEDQAAAMGLKKGSIAIMLHSGSRGLGHQVCDDYIKVMGKAMDKYKITVPDRQLCCAPVSSPEGREYLGAMKAAANFAYANRQAMTHAARSVFSRFFPGEKATMVYDVSHNLASIETHVWEGKKRKVCVHRKGATRAFNGVPVLIPGSMGTSSYVLVGTEGAERETFASSCHGAGRVLGRNEAIRRSKGRNLVRELSEMSIKVMAKKTSTLAEEAPHAYKDVSAVVEVVQGAGLCRKVARLLPVAVMKG
ncbi:MAG: RtcB family protein [Synergistaceae bacterium]|nr:RtcB family protein [Synergistaceae bacterium]